MRFVSSWLVGILVVLGLVCLMPANGVGEDRPANTKAGNPRAVAQKAGDQAVNAQAANPQQLLANMLSHFPEGKPLVTKDEAEQILREILPVVEQAAGRSFKRPPTLRLISRAELVANLVDQLEPEYRRLQPGFSDEEIHQFATHVAQSTAPFPLARYNLIDGTIDLIPSNFESVFRVAKIPPTDRLEVTKLALAHALASALQDQQVGLKEAMARCINLDQLLALNATLQGHAGFVQDRVALIARVRPELATACQAVVAGAVFLEDPQFTEIVEAMRVNYDQLHVQGKQFISHHHAKGGDGRIWEILADPPEKAIMIVQPDSHAPKTRQPKQMDGVFEGIDRLVAAGQEGWRFETVGSEKINLKLAFEAMGKERLARLQEQVLEVRALIGGNMSKETSFAVTLFRLKDDSFGPTFIQWVEELARKNIDMMKGGNLKIEGEQFADFPFQAQSARILSFRISAQGRTIDQVLVRIAKGDAVLEFVLSSPPKEEKSTIQSESIAKLAEAIFKRYDEAKRADAKVQVAQPLPGVQAN